VLIAGDPRGREYAEAFVGAVADLLSDEKRYAAISAAARGRVEQVRARAEAMAGDRLQGRAVVVAVFQKEFVSYYRMEPAAVIGNGELSARELDALVAAARERGAVAVVGNQQSGRKGFEAVAELLGLPLVMLSNFPERRDGRLDYSAFLLANVQALVDGVGRK